MSGDCECTKMCFILVSVPCELEKNAYLAFVWMMYSINVNSNHLTDGVSKSPYAFLSLYVDT